MADAACMAARFGVQRRFMPSSHADTERCAAIRAGCLLKSEERRRARRARREEKRAEKRRERLASCTMENVADLNSLYRAAVKAKNGIAWKSSVQRYEKDVLRNIVKARDRKSVV